LSKAQVLKRILLGRTMASGELERTLLPKTIALPVFASDPLSSNAYATQEILLVLGAAGVGALANVVPISIAVALLLATVVSSYRQTVRAYPSGGGAYRVARENIGLYPGLLAAAALLLDYVLTVAVSITAGVDAIVAMAPDFNHVKVQMVIGLIVLVTIMNLRGVRESGTLFAIPTYGFILSVYVMIITGFVRCLGGCPQAETAELDLHHAAEPLTLFLIFKAFAAGTTALTGVEAIADGVQAFRFPQSKNAATTLLVMGVLATSMFLGISALANGTNVVFEHGNPRTVVAQVAHAVFGGGALFYVIQVMTAGILVLAANTAFQDFPRLSSILAQDRFMPRQFLNRGDRLVFSNGVLILALIAGLLVIVFDADLNRLIQLYLVGVFISFTLSQSGMVLRWRRLKTAGWKKSMAINGLGATVTGVVLCVVLTTKFLGGAWIIMIAIPLVMVLMRSIHNHYSEVSHHLADEERRPVERRTGNHSMVILVERVDVATARAVGYVRSVRPRKVTAITFDEANVAAFKRVAPEILLTVLEKKGSTVDAIKSYLVKERKSVPPEDFLTLVTPELLERRGLWEVITHPRLHRLKAVFLGERHVQILDIPILREDIDPRRDETSGPARNYVVVLVSDVHNATLQAMEYAETLGGTDLRAVSFGIDTEATTKLADDWMEAKIQAPLELQESAFRDIGQSLVSYIQRFKADGGERVVTVVLPEFVVSRFRHQLLHGQTALLVKRHLLFEPGVVVASVPYHLAESKPDPGTR
jgi:amino acid transporter